MTEPASNASTTADAALPPTGRGLGWWIRVIEVRLRFILLVLAIVVVVSQWQRVRSAWDGWWHSLTAGETASAVAKDLEFFCPMDPGVVSNWPAICPICNMDLVQRKKHDAQLLPEGVVARMQLSPYRIQLAGIQTQTVAEQECVIEIPVSGVLEVAPASSADSGAGVSTPRLFFTAPVSRADESLLTEPRTAVVSSAGETRQYAAVCEMVTAENDDATGSAARPRAIVTISDPAGLSAGRVVRAVIQVPLGTAGIAAATTGGSLPVVPQSAVVDHGFQQLVFRESMPGTFDAVEVQLGRRCGDVFPVLAGIRPGDRVASVGAFLIDAETRLNASAAVSYFGANQNVASSRAPRVQVATPREKPALSAEDLRLAALQGKCPVTGLPLDAMGGPVPIDIDGRRVFICCRGCEDRLRQEPQKYLGDVPQP